jgi:coenzyme F420-reducing hydrogenase delta subunit
VFRRLLDYSGIDMNRVHFAWVSAAEGQKWADLINSITEKVRKLGPFKEFQEMVAAS